MAIYRKYRPKNFSDFVGQEHVVRTISNAIKNNIISHAYLFSGPRGTGKTSMARLLAKAINCQNRKGAEPCNKCPSCLEIMAGRALDIIEIDAASYSGVDNVRELIQGIRFSPSSLKYKVFIIDESHQLSKAASNALLKTLEEPPKHAIFILATTEPQKMIPTILSRCQRLDFRLLRLSEIIGKLKEIAKSEGLEIDEGVFQTIARSARGSMRDAESLFDQVVTFSGQDKKVEIGEIKDVLGLVETEIVADFVKLILGSKQVKALDFLRQKRGEGLDLEEFLRALISYLRQALVLKMGGEKDLVLETLTEIEAEELKKAVQDISEDKLVRIIEFFLAAANRIKYAPIPELAIELAILSACRNA